METKCFWNVITLNLKKLYIISLLLIIFNFFLSGLAQSTAENLENVYELEYGGLKIDIMAPMQSYPGENITIKIKAEAITQIFVKYIRIIIYGAPDAKDKLSLSDITHLENSSFSSLYEADYKVEIPNYMAPGLTFGVITSEWELMGSPQKIPQSGFAMTYIRNVDLEKLQADYDSLNATHQSLLQENEELESEFKGELESTQNLLYLFIATTVVASITVIVLLMRKPKKVWI